jgi:gliding motility-associated-like protein
MTTTGVTDASGVAKAYFTSTTVGSVTVTGTIDVGGVQTPLTDYTVTPNTPYSTIQFVTGPPVTGNPGGGGGTGGGGTGGGGTGGGPGGGGGGNPGGGGSGGNGSGDPDPDGGFSHEYVLPDYDFRIADGQQQDSVYARISDASGNPVANYDVTFFISTSPVAGTISSGAQIVGAAAGMITVKTNQYGIAAIPVTSTQPGTVYIAAQIIDPKTNLPAQIDFSAKMITFVAQPDVTNPLTSLTVIIREALADGTQQTEVKAHIVDLGGNIMPNQQVYFTVDSGAGTIVTPQPVMTDANGDAYIYITSKTPGDVLITATVNDKKIVYGSPARVHFATINIYVPRVFTPNNDGTNDVLKPILVGISEFHYFSVYNRWGNLIFTTQDANQGWDGRFKGVVQPVETYLWIAEGIATDGRKIVQRGMVSLVR